MKKIVFKFIFLNLLYILFSQDIDIQKVDFVGVNVANHLDKFDDSERTIKYNLAYSAILPAGGVYNVTDPITGKEALVQVGYSIVNQSPYIIYLSQEMFNFFISTYDKKPNTIKLTIKFLGWNKTGEESQYLDLQSLVVEPDKSLKEITKNGNDKYYIQLGAYSYHQNAFPGITEMLPFLEVRPHFYLIKKDLKKDKDGKTVYRVMAGPYNLDDAKRITGVLNSIKKKSLFIQSMSNIIKEEKVKDKK